MALDPRRLLTRGHINRVSRRGPPPLSLCATHAERGHDNCGHHPYGEQRASRMRRGKIVGPDSFPFGHRWDISGYRRRCGFEWSRTPRSSSHNNTELFFEQHEMKLDSFRACDFSRGPLGKSVLRFIFEGHSNRSNRYSGHANIEEVDSRRDG
jgi:hypothetical protein